MFLGFVQSLLLLDDLYSSASFIFQSLLLLPWLRPSDLFIMSNVLIRTSLFFTVCAETDAIVSSGSHLEEYTLHDHVEHHEEDSGSRRLQVCTNHLSCF